MTTGNLHGEELLVRMQGMRGPDDIIAPDDFLPAAESFGLMPIIDEFMFDQAMRLAASGRHCSVNISATSPHNLTLRKKIVGGLQSAPHAARNLTFEIAETAIVHDLNEAAIFCNTVSECGSRVDLDDFGTGYGNLTELRNLKLSSLKIDISFVRNVATNEQDQQVVRLIVQMAKDFGLTTIAEGVEDTEVMETLRSYGVDYAQGYLSGKPARIDPVKSSPFGPGIARASAALPSACVARCDKSNPPTKIYGSVRLRTHDLETPMETGGLSEHTVLGDGF